MLFLKKLNQPLSLFVFVNATNGKLWLHQETQPMFLIDVVVPWMAQPNMAPFFAGDLGGLFVNMTEDPEAN